MLNIDSIQNGIVIDHIKAGTGMQIYHLAGLDDLDCCVALIRNARSAKHGHKDIIKIESVIDLDLNVLGYIDPDITIDIIRDGKIVEKKKLVKPQILKNVIHCRNPRCITTVEEDIEHIFVLGKMTNTIACTVNRNQIVKSCNPLPVTSVVTGFILQSADFSKKIDDFLQKLCYDIFICLMRNLSAADFSALC